MKSSRENINRLGHAKQRAFREWLLRPPIGTTTTRFDMYARSNTSYHTMAEDASSELNFALTHTNVKNWLIRNNMHYRGIGYNKLRRHRLSSPDNSAHAESHKPAPPVLPLLRRLQRIEELQGALAEQLAYVLQALGCDLVPVLRTFLEERNSSLADDNGTGKTE